MRSPIALLQQLMDGMGVFFWLVSLCASILVIVATWYIFQKANEPGWAAIVPFYNRYVMYKIVFNNGWLMFLEFLSIIPFIGWIAVVILHMVLYINLAHRFSKSTGFGMGLALLSVVFFPILAFGDAKYK